MTKPGFSSDTACKYPLKLEPQFVERVWGAKNLEPVYTTRPPAGRRVGEVWLTGTENRVSNGRFAGKTLQEMTTACGTSLLGGVPSAAHPSGQPVFPLLVKFLFTTDKLSVQVHPADSHAEAMESWGKTEMWHILSAEPGACVAVGFRADLSREMLSQPKRLREAAESGAIEQMLAWQEVHAGETYFVPAGTVHAIGAGITLCEIQQNSDVTYRLYDYNRPGTDGKPRPLHLDRALEVVEWGASGGRTSPIDLPSEAGQRHLLAACPYFVTERWEFPVAPGLEEKQIPRRLAPRDGNGVGRLEIWIELEGAAEFEAGGERVEARQGEVVVIPADAHSCCIRLEAGAALLRTFLPDWERDVLMPLRAAGVSEAQSRKVCFPQKTSAGVRAK